MHKWNPKKRTTICFSYKIIIEYPRSINVSHCLRDTLNRWYTHISGQCGLPLVSQKKRLPSSTGNNFSNFTCTTIWWRILPQATLALCNLGSYKRWGKLRVSSAFTRSTKIPQKLALLINHSRSFTGSFPNSQFLLLNATVKVVQNAEPKGNKLKTLSSKALEPRQFIQSMEACTHITPKR